MKKFAGSVFVIQVIVMICVFASRLSYHRYDFAVVSCISDIIAVNAADVAGLNVSKESKLKAEDIIMQIVYQLARRSVVKVTVKDSVGSGIIWRIDDGIVVASNRHLLMKDVYAEVTFGNQETVKAAVIGYAQQYDIGFVKISKESVTSGILRDVYEAVPVLYETESEASKETFRQNYQGKNVLQVGAVIDKKTANCSTGSVRGLRFVPVFNTNVLETECYSKAGMSGGGVFDENGRLLGMISGGDVPENSEKREAEFTYSIPSALIEAEYTNVLEKQ